MSYARFASPHRRLKPITRKPNPQVSSGLHSRGWSEDAIVTKTVTNESGATMQKRQIEPEGAELLEEVGGGAGRVRTAASQFCRLLP